MKWCNLRVMLLLLLGLGPVGLTMAQTDLTVRGIGVNNVVKPNTPITVEMRIFNSGSTEQSNFTVTYIAEGQAPVQEVVTRTSSVGTPLSYEFTTPLTITEEGPFTLTAIVSAAGDTATSNDTLLKNIEAIANI